MALIDMRLRAQELADSLTAALYRASELRNKPLIIKHLTNDELDEALHYARRADKYAEAAVDALADISKALVTEKEERERRGR